VGTCFSVYLFLDFTWVLAILIAMNTKILAEKNFVRRIEEISGQKLADCYQCGRCTAGCPFARYMDAPPSQVIRFIQLGLRNEVEKSQGPWFCAACLVCQTRCPRGVDIPRLMEAVRVIHLRAKKGLLDVETIDKELLMDAPPLAIMSAFSKYTY
jgi:heterodisulfide reductase subunit C